MNTMIDADFLIATMSRCIELAKIAASKGNYPLGAVVVTKSEVLAEYGSDLIESNDPTAHPEIVVIRAVAEKIGSRYIPGTYLVSTMEPCPMCASAAIWAKMKGIVYGTSQQTAKEWGNELGSDLYTFRQININCLHIIEHGEPRLEVCANLMEKECDELLRLVIR